MTSPLDSLVRKLIREAREWGQDHGARGHEPEILGVQGAIGQPGQEPYVLAFRMTVSEPELGLRRQFTVTVSESLIDR